MVNGDRQRAALINPLARAIDQHRTADEDCAGLRDEGGYCHGEQDCDSKQGCEIDEENRGETRNPALQAPYDGGDSRGDDGARQEQLERPRKEPNESQEGDPDQQRERRADGRASEQSRPMNEVFLVGGSGRSASTELLVGWGFPNHVASSLGAGSCAGRECSCRVPRLALLPAGVIG